MQVEFRDAMLTDKGRKQCQQLHDLTKDTIQKKADLLVSSVVSWLLSPVSVFATFPGRAEHFR